MNRTVACLLSTLLVGSVLVAGCQTPDHATEGAVVGGLGGAGLGALIGNASGHAGAGAAIGAVAGGLTGAAIGASEDKADARNQAMIAAASRPVGTVTVDEVIAMTQNHVDDGVIINQVRANRMVAPLQTGDLIRLRQFGVSNEVIRAMQESPPVPQGVIVEGAPPPPVVVEGYYGPYYRPHRYYY
jgi:outer membrane lipoprotein SlyB